MTIHVLMIEDEKGIRDMLKFALPAADFTIVEAADTPSARACLGDHIPDVILLDWMLPAESGIDFLKWVRKEPTYQSIPVIMLTARAEEEHKVRGLSYGADDYITKPFSPAELVARIKAILRRGAIVSPDHLLRDGDMIVDTAKNTLMIDGQAVELSPLEYGLLVYFIRHPERTYSRDQIIQHVWGGQSDIDDRTVDVHIRRLRNKLKPHHCHDKIKTVRGMGYQWVKHHGE